MSTISNTSARSDGAVTTIPGRLAAAPKRLWTAFLAWRMQKAAVDHLQSLSDRELHDIGISRSQIPGAVAGERDRAIRRHY